MALAQTFGTPEAEQTVAVRMLASMSLPIADHRPVELVDRELAHGIRVGGVGLDDLGEPPGERLHGPGVGVDAEHLDAVVLELQGQRRAEPAEADDDDRPLRADVIS